MHASTSSSSVSSTKSKKAPIVVVRRISLAAEPKRPSTRSTLSSVQHDCASHSKGRSSSSGSSCASSLAGSRRNSVSPESFDHDALTEALERHPHSGHCKKTIHYHTSDLARGRPELVLSSSSSSNSAYSSKSSSLDLSRTWTASSTSSASSAASTVTAESLSIKDGKASALRSLGKKLRHLLHHES